MDFISISDGITGLVTAANQIISHFHKALITDADTLSTLGLAVGHLKIFRSSISVVGDILHSLDNKANARSSLITLEAVRSIITDSLLVLSDLQRDLGQVVGVAIYDSNQASGTATNFGRTTELIDSIRQHQSSLALLVKVFESASDGAASRHAQNFQAQCNQLAVTNLRLSMRFETMSQYTASIRPTSIAESATDRDDRDDDSDADTIRASNRKGGLFLPGGSERMIAEESEARRSMAKVWTFERELQSSRVYRNAKSDECDVSFDSSIARWSVLSGLSLSEISIVSAVALPLLHEEVSDCTWFAAMVDAATSESKLAPQTDPSPVPESQFSGLFHSAMPGPDNGIKQNTEGMEVDNTGEYKVLFTAASLFEFNIATTRREGGFPYLRYVPGELFDVIGEKGELWLAKNQDDTSATVGWIWEKHFAKLAADA